MTDNKDETAKYTIYVLDLDNMAQEAADGIEVAATMKSLEISLHQMVLGNREATPDYISYYMRHVTDLLQFARIAVTITKLQMILKTLDEAKSALEQDEDAEQSLRNAWQLMQSVLSLEEVEKIPANLIELRRSALDPMVLSGVDMWEQANHLLQEWSTSENEDQRVEYRLGYDDGLKDGGWLKLPLFYKMDDGERWRIGPALELGQLIIAALEKNIDRCSEQRASFETARQEALAYLRQYAIGGSAGVEAVTTAILNIQKDQWSPGIIYRHALHSEQSMREGSLNQRVGGNMSLHATYTPSDEVEWGYRLYLAGMYDLQAVKRLAMTGQEVAIEGVVHDALMHQTSLDFSVLPGDDHPAVLADGETVVVTVLQGEVVLASIVFHRDPDDSFRTETWGCDLTYLP
jgi:hypothetical protein